jgi:tRNA(Glu) U13 pseudouridine synthase TruD
MTAGTKDKRAMTSQLVTVRNTEPLKILNSVRNNSKIAVGNFSFTKKPLQLGHLKVRDLYKTNFFCIIILGHFYRVIDSSLH